MRRSGPDNDCSGRWKGKNEKGLGSATRDHTEANRHVNKWKDHHGQDLLDPQMYQVGNSNGFKEEKEAEDQEEEKEKGEKEEKTEKEGEGEGEEKEGEGKGMLGMFS